MPLNSYPQSVPMAVGAETDKVVARVLPAVVDEGAGQATVRIQLSQAAQQEIRIGYWTDQATARSDAPADYVSQDGELVFAPGETSKTLQITITDDALVEATEVFWINVYGSGISTQWYVPVTVLDNDGPRGTPALSVSDPVVDETLGLAQFFVTLSQPSASTVTVAYGSVDGSALAGSDYTAVSGTLSFAPGERVKTVSVPVRDDVLAEPDERFSLALSQATGATLAKGVGVAMIGRSDGEPANMPVVTARTLTVAEGDTHANFVVQLSAPSKSPVQVTAQFDAVSTAWSFDDVRLLGGPPITFAPGETTKLVQALITDDAQAEPSEVFWLFMHTVGQDIPNVTVGQAKIPATIVDDDAPRGTPSLRLDDQAVNETDQTVTLYVTLDRPSASTVTVDYTTADGSAQAGTDYRAATGTLSFAPGEMVKAITLTVWDDALAESDERFEVHLKNAVNGTLGDAAGSVMIGRNDTPRVAEPTVSITPVTVSEGDTFATVLVQLSAPAREEVRLSVPFSAGSANTYPPPSDYYQLVDQLVFLPGETVKSVYLVLADDTSFETTETVLVTATKLVNAIGPAGNTVVTLLDNDSSGTLFSHGRSNDQYTVTSVFDRIAESPNGGIDTVTASISLTLPDNVEHLVLTGSALNGLGNAGHNTFTGTAANNSFDGKDGIDTVVFTAPRAAYVINGSTTQRTVSGGTDGTDGTDTLTAVERLQFSDVLLASDTTPGGNTYLAYAMLNAVFNAAPTTAMLSQWTAQLDRLGNLTDTAQAFLNTYAPGLPDEVLVAHLWSTITGTQIPLDALATYTTLVGNGTYTQAGLLALVSTLDLNTVEITSIVGQTLTLDASWFAVPGG
ncbi:MAG: hypothetical protein HY855_04535 [Burkholderiales bacterium]|nr:hypothetical protein [Burkholderiales bacterium]